MTLYWQDITQRGEPKSYETLNNMVRAHLERKRLDKNKDAWDKHHAKGGGGNKAAVAGREATPSNGPKRGDCRHWAKEGKCSRGDKCPWKNSHTDDKAGARGRSPSRGRNPGKEKNENLRNEGGAQERGKATRKATLLSAPLLPTRVKNEESHLRAKRIALLALTTSKEKATTVRIAIGGMPPIADSLCSVIAPREKAAAACVPRIRQRLLLRQKLRRRRKPNPKLSQRPKEKFATMRVLAIYLLLLLLLLLLPCLVRPPKRFVLANMLKSNQSGIVKTLPTSSGIFV